MGVSLQGRVETSECFSWSIFDYTQMILHRVRQKAANSGQFIGGK